MHVYPYRWAVPTGDLASGPRLRRSGLIRTKDKSLVAPFPALGDPATTLGFRQAWRLAVAPGMSAPSQLERAVRIEGDLYSQEDVFVNGEIIGNVIAPNHMVTIGPNGNVKANIKARNVVLTGNMEGDIEASERIELRSQCNLLGDVRGRRIVVENGALIKGSVEVLR